MIRLTFALLSVCAIPLSASTIVTGKLTSAGGRPIDKAHVHIAEDMYTLPLKSVEVRTDGSYSIEVDDKTPYVLLQFTGSSHKMEAVPLILENEKTVQIDVRLQPNAMPASVQSVVVISDVNDYDFGTGTEMKKQPNGTYTASIASSKPTLSYQVVIADGSPAMRSINGTMYDELVYDNGGDYRSVVPVRNGVATVVFDPSKMAPTTAPASVQFVSTSKQIESFSLAARDTEARKNKLMMALQTARSEEESKAVSQELKGALEELAARIDSENDASVRRVLLLMYLDLGMLTRFPREKTHPVVERAFREIPPESPLWAYKPSLHYAMSATSDADNIVDYERAMLKANVSPIVRKSILAALLSHETEKGNEKEAMQYYNTLLSEFPESSEADYARREFSPNRAVQKGKAVPAFSVVSLDNAAQKYSNESLKGKYYLIDFWATWCGPCVQEMPHLHDVYEKYKDKNFEILSLSFDGKPDDIAKFRGKKWKMPWLHTFVEGGFESDLGKAFEVNGIPKPVLVDPNGVIVATSTELRSDNLMATLAKFLGPADTAKK